jgi:hypothetical protein
MIRVIGLYVFCFLMLVIRDQLWIYGVMFISFRHHQSKSNLVEAPLGRGFVQERIILYPLCEH